MSTTQSDVSSSGGERTDAHASEAPRLARPARMVRNQSVRRAMLSVIRPHLNPLIVKLAGGKRLKMVAVIHHRGRRSGRAYTTPAMARLTADGFVVPMTFGPQADWVQNVRAAGGCVIEWNGAEYPVVEPEVIDWAAARAAFPVRERVMLRLMGMANFVRLRHAPATGNGLQAT